MSMQISASASMASEAEDYELGEVYYGKIEGSAAYQPHRYYKFYITEKSHVTLYATKDTKYDTEFNIYNTSGKKVLLNIDIDFKENITNGTFSGNQSRTLNKGVYYLDISNGWYNRSFSFRIEAEKQIKLPKGSISSLKSKKKGQFTVSCKTSKDAIGYRIQYSTDYKFKKGVKTIYSPSVTKTVTKLKAGTRYYVKVCPYTVYDDGVRVYGQNSLVKQVVIKKK